ncbi:hypothetical protein RADP37_04285 [Roseomonas mucosa]|uniref:Uncharacterized protein n=1 Tax=Roseomonas mucosa TaxID=207340 RepID=A0A4Y1N027_9PROT|nr:hypothetical protein RADP37_04285 [Roseomonas mucosa]
MRVAEPFLFRNRYSWAMLKRHGPSGSSYAFAALSRQAGAGRHRSSVPGGIVPDHSIFTQQGG